MPVQQEEEISLDPKNWDELEALGKRMVSDMILFLKEVRDRPAWQAVPDDVKARIRSDSPLNPTRATEVYEAFLQDVLPYAVGNIHPRFWGWVKGAGTPLGMFAEMLSGAMNCNNWGAGQSPAIVEEQVIRWFSEAFGFGDSSGLLVTGGTEANLTCLAVARNAMAPFDVAQIGMQSAPVCLTMYGSQEMHVSVQKSAELLGIGNEYLRRISVDDQFRIRVPELRDRVAQDRDQGHCPICVVANVGTVNTAAIDPINQLADFCEEQKLWLHLDGAFGAICALSQELKPLVEGLDRGDSLAFDLHKWLQVQYQAGGVLIKHPEAHLRTFSPSGTYLAKAARGTAAGDYWPSLLGIQLSRDFKALKAWMTLKEHGFERLGQIALQNVRQARHLADLVNQSGSFELMAPVSLNIVCFRYVREGMSDEALNRLNSELLMRVQEEGIAVPSSTVIDGKYSIRCAITNHRSRLDDFDLLMRELERIAGELESRATFG